MRVYELRKPKKTGHTFPDRPSIDSLPSIHQRPVHAMSAIHQDVRVETVVDPKGSGGGGWSRPHQ
jgi:hypothetical protein